MLTFIIGVSLCLMILSFCHARPVGGDSNSVMTEDEVHLFTEEAFSQLFFLIDKGDITSKEAFKIFLRLPISRAMFLPTVEQLEQNPSIYNKDPAAKYGADDYDYEEEEEEETLGQAKVNTGIIFL